MRYILLFTFIPILFFSSPAHPQDDFTIEVFATTMTQIVLQWENEPENTVSFQVQRATDAAFTQNLKTYNLDDNTRLFSDTDREPPSKMRFNGAPYFGAPLDTATTYYYRVKADLDGGGSQYSNGVSAQVSGPVRGVEGDLWADIVLGQSDFGGNVVGKPTRHGTFFPGGMVIDKSVRPNRMYIADCNNNRILGFEHLGVVELGLTSSQNLARNKTYTKSAMPHGSYPDTNNREFTDGTLSTSLTNSFAYHFSSPGSVDVDVDLGPAQEFNFAAYSTGGGREDYRAGSVTIFVSEDGTDWTEVASKDNPNVDAEIRLLFDATTARYVRFRGTSQAIPGWLAIGEGQVGSVTGAQIAEEGNPCSTDSDCEPGNTCRLTPEKGADIVIGQPDFISSSGNGDSCAQSFPHRGPAGTSTLCLTLPTQISMAETIVRVNMAVDDEGSLYVPDVFNNRVLKYENPFGTDSIADEVWGQDDFLGNEANKGMSSPSSNSLRLEDAHQASVAFDSEGNMWVADNGNNRMLRFLKDTQTGIIAKNADVVLGQQSFFTRIEGGWDRTLAEMWLPRDGEFDHNGRLYVSDGIYNNYDGRLIVFDPPFTSGMSATQEIPVPRDMDPSFGPGSVVLSIVRDPVPNRMWFLKSTFTTELVDMEYGESLSFVTDSQASCADVDCDGNLFIVAKWSGIFRYPSTSWYLPWSERQVHRAVAFPVGNAITADTMGGILGITTFQDQLVISERARMLIWNNFDIGDLTNGQPADDVYGQVDFTSMAFDVNNGSFVAPQVDSQGRLWACKTRYGNMTLQAFQYPLTNSSTPLKNIVIRDGDTDVLSVKGGGSTKVEWADVVDFAIQDSGDKIWVADRSMSRVLRINNIDGLEDPSVDLYVDIILGQQNITDGELNQGGAIGPQTLAWPYNVDVSPGGDLYISDNGGEVGSNRRILRYNKNRFPDNPATVLFNADIGDPDSVIGTGGSLHISGHDSMDPVCCPFELGIHPQGSIVAGMNGYSAQRFPLVYLDPITNTLPQMALADFTSYPTTCFADREGNVYMGDWDWFRVLVWKKPFKHANDYFSILSVDPLELTESVEVTWKSRRSRSYKVYWADDDLSPSLVWNEVTGPEAVQSGTGGRLHLTDDGITTYGHVEHAPLNPIVRQRYYRIREERE